MSDRDELAGRVSAIVGLDPRISEKRMFGGIGYFVNGNMFIGVTSKGQLMAKYAKGDDERARALPRASEVDFTDKKMAGFLVLSPDVTEEDDALAAWVRFCLEHALGLPPKVKAERRK